MGGRQGDEGRVGLPAALFGEDVDDAGCLACGRDGGVLTRDLPGATDRRKQTGCVG